MTTTRSPMSPTAKQDDANSRRLFGTDGIRGMANEPPMTPELALSLGRAVTFVAGRGKSHVPRILIGKDTRISVLHAGDGHGRRRLLHGRRRDPVRAHPHARGGPPHLEHARGRGRGHQRQPQPVLRQRHQDLRHRRLQAGRRGGGGDRAAHGGREPAGRRARPAPRSGARRSSRTRGAATWPS